MLVCFEANLPAIIVLPPTDLPLLDLADVHHRNYTLDTFPEGLKIAYSTLCGVELQTGARAVVGRAIRSTFREHRFIRISPNCINMPARKLSSVPSA